MSIGNQPLTFISYSRADSEFALQLANELRSSGFNIWLDQLDIPTGCRWDDEVENALKQCNIFLVILTPHSIDSNNVKDEIGYAIDSNKRILPVLLENAAVPFRMRRFQYVNFTGKSYEEGIESAKQLLRNQVNKLLSIGDWVPIEAKTTGVRILPRRLVEQQMQPGQASPINQEKQTGRQVKADKDQPRSFWNANLIPILLGFTLLTMVCLFGVMYILPNLSWQKPVNNTILPIRSQSDFPTANPVSTRFTIDPPTQLSPAATLVDTVTFTSTLEPTLTFTPIIPSITPKGITVPSVSIPSDPSAFIYFYFDNINTRNYDLTWSLLSDKYKATHNLDGKYSYMDFWNGYNRVDLTSVDYSYLTNKSVKVITNITLYKSNSSSTNKITYYLTSDNPQGIWLFDVAPAEGGSAMDTSCKKVSKTLSVGITAKVVTATDPLLLRDGPSDTAGVYERMSPGTMVFVIDGPICGPYRSVYFWWWKVQSPSGKVGWVVEGADVTDPSFIRPAN